MEVEDVLADEVVELGGGILLPVFVEVDAPVGAELLEAGHVAYRGVQPDIEVLAGCVGDLETEIGCVAGDVPVGKAGGEPLAHLVGSLGLQCSAAGPGLEEVLAGAELEEVVLGLLAHRCGAGDGGIGIH